MRAASNNEKSTGLASASLGVINSITSGINKKSFFKGFLGRGSSSKNEKVNKSLNPGSSSANRTGSMVGVTGHLSNMQTAAMNMMFKNKNTEKDLEQSKRSFGRQFGKDITNKVLNSSGAMSVQNQSDSENNRHTLNQKPNATRKPSPSIHSNY